MHVAGTTVLLTGAAGGIGGFLAEAFVRAGARVVLTDRDEAGLARTRARAGQTTASVVADLRDLDQVERLVDRASQALGPVDVLVNNAALDLPGAYTAHTRDELDDLVTVNLLAPMVLIRAALPGMLERGRGHVATVSSISGKGAAPYLASYATTKAALIELNRSLRLEYREAPVGFSVICPGFVAEAGMYARMKADGDKAPLALGTSSPRRVAGAVVRAVEHDTPERNIASRPMAPLFALSELVPGAGDLAIRATGARRFLKSVAARRNRLQ